MSGAATRQAEEEYQSDTIKQNGEQFGQYAALSAALVSGQNAKGIYTANGTATNALQNNFSLTEVKLAAAFAGVTIAVATPYVKKAVEDTQAYIKNKVDSGGGSSQASAGGSTASAGAPLPPEDEDPNKKTNYNIDQGKQDKHIAGTNNYKPTNSEVTYPDPQALVDEFSGTGTPLNKVPVGQAGSQEVVDTGKIIGNFIQELSDGTYTEPTPTTRMKIMYAKDGVHIVPAPPEAPIP